MKETEVMQFKKQQLFSITSLVLVRTWWEGPIQY